MSKFQARVSTVNITPPWAFRCAGERFVDYQLTIDQNSPFDRTITLGYSNGCIGSVPTANAYPEGGYELEQAFKYYGTLMITL